MTVSSPAILRTAAWPHGGPFISMQAAQRLCIDLIAAEQARLLREKRLSPRQRIEAVLADCPPGMEGEVEIGEDALGFDSLMLLDLVGVVSRYFCLSDSGAEDLLLVHRRLGDWAKIVAAHFDRLGGDARITFETSGSTGAPKQITHRLGTLVDEADEELRVLLGAPPGPKRVLSAVPPRHIYGFIWSILLPQAAGADVFELHRSPHNTIFRLCQAGDIVLGTPFTWERTATFGLVLPPGVTGVTSAGPTSEATWNAAKAIGLDRLVEVYGSTETGGVGWRQSGLEPFRLFQRVARNGDGATLTCSCADVALQDRLIWRGTETFVLGGRRDAVVQVAGTNVSCDAVAALLERVEGVSDAAVRLDGSRLVALVVPARPRADFGELEDALRAQALRDLPAPARPDRYHFAMELPRSELGKVAAWPELGAP